MAKFSKMMGGKEVGQADVYAKPHDAKGGMAVNLGNNGYPNAVPSTQTSKTRGTGAATKGNKHSTKMG
jgi:hypothetical protein